MRYYGFNTYLEIGVQRKTNTFNHIHAHRKIGVDPDPNAEADFIMGSDEYFENHNKGEHFDLIFIDGLHHADQVVKDIQNSLTILNKNGIMIIDDCMPHNELMQKIPRDETPNQGNGPGRLWTGDVWKAIAWIRLKRKDLSFLGVKLHCGMGVVKRESVELLDVGKELESLTFADYKENEQRLLNLVSYDRFLELYPIETS